MNNFLNINEISQKNLEAILEDANTVKRCSVAKDQYINSLKNSITGLARRQSKQNWVWFNGIKKS